jgi:hypothetical protein
MGQPIFAEAACAGLAPGVSPIFRMPRPRISLLDASQLDSGGIGSCLISEVIRHAKELGWRAIDLEVDASHQRAISLYLRHQFRLHSRSRLFWTISTTT